MHESGLGHSPVPPVSSCAHHCRIPHDVESEVRPLRGTHAPFALVDGTARVIDTYSRALEQAPSFRIYFTPDQRPVEMCLAEVMRSSV